jgi:hypothetical protein
MNSVDVFANAKIYLKHYTASKTVGLLHIMVRKKLPKPAVHTITSIAKIK